MSKPNKNEISRDDGDVTPITTPLKRSSISSISEERLIRVMRADTPEKNFYSATFAQSEVEAVISTRENTSALLLRSGVKIPVALTYGELEQKIYRPDIMAGDEAVLDLRNLTGEAMQPNKTAANVNELTVGDKMPDGTIYAGVSPDTGKEMFAMPEDSPWFRPRALVDWWTWGQAMQYAENLDAHTHKDWRLPSLRELKVLFNNRAAIGGFVEDASTRKTRYWSADECGECCAWTQRFSNGYQDTVGKSSDHGSSVRLVR